MHPRLFELPWRFPTSDRSRSTRYGVLLAAAYLLACSWRWSGPASAASTQTRVIDLGHLHHHQRARRREAAAARHRFPDVHGQSARAAHPRAIGRRVLRRADPRRRGGAWYIRRVGLPLWTTCDVFAPGIALGHVIGRFGCFFAGCCFGKPTTCRGASRSPIRSRRPTSARRSTLPLHPTQLYEAGAELLILVLLLGTERGRRFAGRTFWLYMLVVRRVALHHRDSSAATSAARSASFSTSQFISVILAPLAVAMLVYLARRRGSSARSGAQEGGVNTTFTVTGESDGRPTRRLSGLRARRPVPLAASSA